MSADIPSTSLSDELHIHNLLNETIFYVNNIDKNESYDKLSRETIQKVHKMLGQSVRDTFENFSAETIIFFAEVGMKVKGQEKLAEEYITYFFQRNYSQGQVYIRALLLQATLTAKKGEENHSKPMSKAEDRIENLSQALDYVKKAIEIISQPLNKEKYAFLIYNCSVIVYEIIRPMLRPQWQRNFVDIVEKIDKLFQDVNESDYNWRCNFTLLLFQCLYDTEKSDKNDKGDRKAEAIQLFNKLWETTQKNGDCEFQETLFRLKIHLCKENSSLAATLKKDVDTAPKEKSWGVLYTLQQIKSKLMSETTVEKELNNLINSISSLIAPGQDSSSKDKMNPVYERRLAEAGRVALSLNPPLTNIADNVGNILGKVRQLDQVAYIWNEFNKAELFIKKPGQPFDPKTGMRMNSVQLKKQEVERRIEALKILDKAMISCKNIKNPELIYEGSYLIWNISLPFLNATYRTHINRAFLSACSLLEMIQSGDHALRVNLHLELAKSEIQDDSITMAESHIRKALALDYSIPLRQAKEKFKIDPNEDLALFQRPYDRYLNQIKEKIRLKKTHYDHKNHIEKAIIDLESISKGVEMKLERLDIIQKCFGYVYNFEEPEFPDSFPDLVPEEIENERKIHKQNNMVLYKQKKQLAGEIAKLAFEWELNDLALKACDFVIQDKWEIRNASEMVLIQIECYFIQSQCLMDMLLKEGFEIPFAEPLKINDEEDEKEQEERVELTAEKKEQILSQKRAIISSYQSGLKLAEEIGQTWLVFNGAIYIWNNFLPVFRNPSYDTKLLTEIQGLLKDFFEAMKKSLKELEKKQITDHDIDSKIQVFANIGLIYARLMETKQNNNEVLAICDSLLLTPLNPHTLKLINSIKARNLGAAKIGSMKVPEKKGAAGQQAQVSSDSVIFDVVSQIEIIKNSTNKSQTQELIKKCYETLSTWKAKENDETELEMHSELWARLARLALNEENALMYKYSLNCVENSLLHNTSNDLQGVPPSRLRWYSLAEYLYSETLMRMLSQDSQETESQEKLMFHALKHAVEAANKGMRANMNVLLLDASKQIWNICTRLQESAVNRKALLKPLFSTIFYLKNCKEKSEPDLVLLLSQLFFKAAMENDEFQLGENCADMVFELVPKNLNKPIWEAKMIFMSKQGKNELQAISNMKETDASLKAKVWIRLARASTNVYKQQTAYNKAIEILKKENSADIVEVLIEFSEWLLRNSYERNVVEENLLSAADILIDIENEEEEEDDEDDDELREPTIFSRSSRGKKSSVSKTSKNKSKVSSTQSKKSPRDKLKKPGEQKSSVGKGDAKSSMTRMSRVSIRATKTIKSKQSKSIFTQREEDPNPEMLNCAHYERLMRIHAMLAMISNSQEQQIQYCLDAKFFIIKIFEISFKTLNKLDQNQAKYSNMKDDKAPKGTAQATNVQNTNFTFKYILPSSTEEWIKLQLSKEFLEKVKSFEDYNFMSKFVFEKAELTFNYIDSIINILENYGLHIHAVPFYVLLRFLAKEIISAGSILYILAETRFAGLLYKLGYVQEAENSLNAIGFKKFRISETERKTLYNRAESSRILAQTKVTKDISDTSQNTKPFLVKEIQAHHVWLQISKEMIAYTDISRGKDLLAEAEQHAKILKDMESLAEIQHLKGVIAYTEGDYVGSLQFHMMSHKLIKGVPLWERSALETVKTLKKLSKPGDIYNFLGKMIDVFAEVSGKQNFSYNKLDVAHVRATLELLYTKTLLSDLSHKSFSYDKFKKAMEHLDNFEKETTGQCGVKLLHLDILLGCFFKLSKIVEELNYCDKDLVEKAFKVLEKIIAKLVRYEQVVKNLLKYTLLLEKENQAVEGPLSISYSVIKILLARCFVETGVLKSIMRGLDFKKLETSEKVEQEKEPTISKFSEYEPLNKYLTTLTYKIERSLLPIPTRLESFEKSIAILVSLTQRLPKTSYFYIFAKVELVRARRLLAASKKQLKELWNKDTDKKEDDEDSDEPIEENVIMNMKVDYKMEALKSALELTQSEEIKSMDDVLMFKHAYFISRIMAIEMVENFGILHPETTFEYIAKFQHYQMIELFQRIFKDSASQDSKILLLQRIIKYVQKNFNIQNQENLRLLKEEFRVWDLIHKPQDLKELIKDVLPNASAYLLLQMSENKQYMYVGYMFINKQRETKYFCLKKKLSIEHHDLLRNLISKLDNIQTTLVKTPLITDTDMIKIETEMQAEYDKVLVQLEDFCSFFTKPLNELINVAPPEPENIDIQPIDPKLAAAGKGKDAGKDAAGAKKDAGKKKDETAAYESPLKPSDGGVESLTLLIDQNIFKLPLENLKVFSKIPAVSRDFSLALLGKRYKNISFNPTSNNSIGMARSKLKYIFYDFKIEERNNINAFPVFNECMKKIPNVKPEGVTSTTRVSSVGEWQKYLTSASLMMYYGHSGIFDILSPKLFVELMEITRVPAFFIVDKINARKNLLEKYAKLDPEADSVPVVDQPFKTIVLLSLLGTSSIALNRWSVKPEEYRDLLDKMLTGVGEEIYFAATINKYKEPVKVYFDEEGKEVDVRQRLEDFQKEQAKKDNKKQAAPPKGGAKGPGKETGLQQASIDEPTDPLANLKAVFQDKRTLYAHNMCFVGVPVIRLS